MPTEFTAVLVKGRRNYISLRRMKNALGRNFRPIPACRAQFRHLGHHVMVVDGGRRRLPPPKFCVMLRSTLQQNLDKE